MSLRENSVVVITGATSGLGLSLAKLFLDKNYVTVGISCTKKHWPNAKQETKANPQFVLFETDVTNEAAVRRLFSNIIKKYGRIDVLINNAGYGGNLSVLDETSSKEFQKHIANNLYSIFLTCKYVIPIFQKQKSGWILNISSMAGKRAVPKLAAYSASKFGVLALSQSIAKENAESGFKCVTVCPGGMNTKMRSDLFGQEDANKQQSPDFVAGVISKIIDGEIKMESGGDIVIRHSQITAINPAPAA